MKASIRKKLTRRKCRIERRLRPKKFKERSKPMLAAANIQYDVAVPIPAQTLNRH